MLETGFRRYLLRTHENGRMPPSHQDTLNRVVVVREATQAYNTRQPSAQRCILADICNEYYVTQKELIGTPQPDSIEAPKQALLKRRRDDLDRQAKENRRVKAQRYATLHPPLPHQFTDASSDDQCVWLSG
jgi:hypothetical protein